MAPYIRKTERQAWDEKNMTDAIEAVRSKRMGWHMAAKAYSVPATTLRRRAEKGDSSKGYLGGHKTTFTKNLEKQIIQHLQELEVRFFGMTTIDLRKLAYQIAVSKKIPHRFSTENEMAGLDWLRGFRKRNPSISLRIPEATSAARARAFNKVQVKTFFTLLIDVTKQHNFEPHQIWNVDESGFSTVPSQNPKVFATKGRKQVGVLTSAERGQHYTTVCCVNALGSFIPPAFIFPRKNMKAELMDRAPTGAVGFAQEKGWMNGEVFLKWMQHFVKYAKPSKEAKALLLLDGHSSHKNLDVLTFAKENNIILFCFPPHCTHKMQPLDVSFFGPLNTFYNQELRIWLRNHPGRTVTHFQVAELFKQAYLRAATVNNGQNGFAASGIYPLNENIFPEWMFAPADVTDNDLGESSVPILSDLDAQNSQLNDQAEVGPLEDTRFQSNEQARQRSDPTSSQSNELAEAGPSKPIGFQSNELSEAELLEPVSSQSNDQTDQRVSPTIADISPLPKSSQITRITRKKGKFGMLNASPDIAQLKAIVAEKQAAALRKSARQVKKRVMLTTSSDEEEPFASDDEDTCCIYCMEPFSHSRSREWWLQCQICRQWCHAECIGLPKTTKRVICDICK